MNERSDFYSANPHIHEYEVKGVNVLVELVPVSTKIEGSMLYMAEDKAYNLQLAEMKAIVRAVGNAAWKDRGEPYAKVGDHVFIKRYNGTEINRDQIGNQKKTEPILKIIEDLDVLCVYRERENNK